MQIKKVIASVATAMLLSLSAFAAPQNDTSFSALQGVEAQALSVQEMQAITGELNAIDIGNALLAYAATLPDGRFKTAVTSLGNYYLANAGAINAAFAKLGILTPCKTCQ
jgi:hypothetical protein